MSKNEAIGVAAGILVVAVLLFGQNIIGVFTNGNNNMIGNTPGVEQSDTVVGTGVSAAPGDTVTVNYIGTLPDGKVFDSSYDKHQPFTFVLGAGQVIKGWDQGVVGMQVGGKRHLVISPEFAYGPNAVGTIPANSTLVFDVELLSVNKSAVTQ